MKIYRDAFDLRNMFFILINKSYPSQIFMRIFLRAYFDLKCPTDHYYYVQMTRDKIFTTKSCLRERKNYKLGLGRSGRTGGM